MENKILLWMDPDISSEENLFYQKLLKKCIKESYFFPTVDDGIEKLKLIYFRYTIIILSCQFYDYFYKQFQNNLKNFNTLSKVYIFTSEENAHLVNEGLYNYQKKITNINDLKNEIQKPHLIELEGNSIINNIPLNINELYECNVQEFTFDIINELEDMILPIFFQNLISDYDYKEQIQFQRNIYEDYSSYYEDIKSLLLPIFDYKEIPIEILAKIYLRLYSIDCDFCYNLNSKLKEGNGKEYVPFVKCLYKGINSKTLNPFFSQKLYRGTNIGKSEFHELKNLKQNQKYFPKLIVFSRAFLSFSEDKNVALRFIEKKENCYEILFEIEKTNSKLDISLCSNADIKNISIFEEEKEILFFPGSTFEITNIQEIDGIKTIKLSYLGKYKKLIKKKHLHTNFFKLIKPNSKFYKFIQQESNKKEKKNSENFSLFSLSNVENKIKKSLIPNLDSKIIKTEKENHFIKNLISPSINIELKLLYRKSIDGESFETFHKKCDNIKENIIFVKSKEGIKFGGYYPNNWESLDNEVEFLCDDVKIFNIEKQKIFSHKTNIKYNIIKSKTNGPNFTRDFSFIVNDMNTCCSFGNDAFLEEKNLANNKNDIFLVDEVEVFQIIYEDLEDEITNGFSKEICYDWYKETNQIDDYTSNKFIEDNCPKPVLEDKIDKKKYIKKKIHSIITINNQNNNYILSYYKIKQNDLNYPIQLINYFSKKNNESNDKFSGVENEKEIKLNCENYFENNKIDFSHIFNDEGIHSIKTICKNTLQNINFMFSKCTSLISINFCHFNSILPKNTNFLFYKCNNLETIEFSNFNTSNVTNMSYMFSECESITILNLSDFNTSNVRKMNGMFFSCYKLNYLNVSSFQTKNVIKMNKMFYNCNSLKELNLTNFITDNVLDMSFMFYNCNSLKKLQFKFNTHNCINMESMFSKCSSLISLDLSNFDTSKVRNMNSMFNECKSLTNLNLNNFYTRNLKNMENMFKNCILLEELFLSNCIICNVENMSNLFYNCFKLKTLDISNFELPRNIDYKNIFTNMNITCNIKTNDLRLKKEFNNYIYN